MEYTSSSDIKARLIADLKIGTYSYQADLFRYIWEVVKDFGGKANKQLCVYPKTVDRNGMVTIPNGVKSVRSVMYKSKPLSYGRPSYMAVKDTDNFETPNVTNNYSYVIDGPFVKTDLDEDEIILLVCRVAILDDDGFVMVPDTTAAYRAIYWYVVQKLFMSGYKLKFTTSVDQAEVYYDKYLKQFKASVVMEAFANEDNQHTILETNLRLTPADSKLSWEVLYLNYKEGEI